MPFFPVVNGKRLNTLQIPQTLPTTHECLQAQKATRDTVIDFILENYLIEEGLNVFTVHDWLEGLSGNRLVVDFIKGALALGYRFLRLRDAAEIILQHISIFVQFFEILFRMFSITQCCHSHQTFES